MNIKKILSGLALGVAVCGCMGGSFSSNFVTLCNFEYSNVGASPWVDSVMFAQEFADQSGSLIFHNKQSVDKDIHTGGFAISVLRDTTFKEGYVKSFYSVADTSKMTKKGNGFVVYYDNPRTSLMPDHAMTFQFYKNGTCTPNSMYRCNTNYVANAALFGVPGCPKFQAGDYIKLRITGINEGKTTGSTEVDLVNYSDKGLTLVRGWKKVELDKIGAFQYLDLNILSNREDAPRYCCIDSFMASITISD